METDRQYDAISSNGLNIYEPDDARVVQLYARFFRVLKPGGTLVTSFLVPPPWPLANGEHLKKQKAVFADILQVQWQHFRTEDQTRKQLKNAGFRDCVFLYDSRHMFPTVVAHRQGS
ncbi:MAG: class I SAM-dependent methyltransferase [Pseudomonadota bacterium]|nr:class I SAM-dependent methyltransferase [Pseudomonadota bacterium]